MDETLSALAAVAAGSADPGKPWALAALGGYGAGRLLPYSDIDLLIACEARPDSLQPLVRAVLYPLWDAGMKVGYSVRGRKDALAAAKDDLADRTSRPRTE
jgi:[protein-PII] uridylyltransferase